jgi:hypothetical protein
VLALKNREEAYPLTDLERHIKILYIKRFHMPLRLWQQELWQLFEHYMFMTPSSGSLFNMYRDEAVRVDKRGAAETRRGNLRNYLCAFTSRPATLVIGEAPGPWGCRFTGVPYTSERLYVESALPFVGQKTSVSETPHGERSAAIFWNVMTPHFPNFFTWNALPFHPHRSGEPLSIRSPKASEIYEHLGLLDEIMRIVEPEQLFAVGRAAQGALMKLNRSFVPIRHPSHGGARDFREGINAHLNLIYTS